MGVFHWGCLVCNYGFFEGRGNVTYSVRIGCSFPACRGGSAKYQTYFIFDQPSWNLDPDPGSVHLVTVMCHVSLQLVVDTSHIVQYCYHLVWKHLPDCHGSVTGHNYTEGNWPFVKISDLTWSLLVKTRSLQVFGHRVGNISAGQAINTPGQAVNRNQHCSYSSRQAGKCIGQDGFILSTHVISVYIR